ncbi:glycogen debranching protein GlgX [Clostridium cellulovorans]|uniref:Glycogen debranching enzyme GlgX n=2 Tax=Clostridium cellulovorans TaxID=1493 RepID=D9SU21_CLOC7|nr:glycogen debranching protein GlgX [Clostridium cellulovorans]ADL50859.1 glycogen debranching enzyme GlgX [Clostridium cellulovorans 743B]BAV13092.1 pullulanase [Clostridium cellulovorans]
MEYEIDKGFQYPFGATVREDGVNFSVFSENASSVELLLFNSNTDIKPFQIITLDNKNNKTFSVWHVFVKGLKPGVFYGYRVDGPQNVNEGHRFNKNKVLIDPYAKGNCNDLWDRGRACDTNDNLDVSMRSVVIDVDTYDWEDDQLVNIPMKDTMIYEMHVRGFTKSETSKVENPGTFLGIIEKIPYLKDLGINAVELLPVFEFDEKEVLKVTEERKKLVNYWGYSTMGFFAPTSNYCVNPEFGKHLNEFRDMVKALHKAGIQVILDVVFNHSNEGNDKGPVINFKGLDNSIYYYLNQDSKEYYFDYSGCGNTMNCNHPIMQKFIIDCLEFWVEKMHVDGFRFDEGSILSRGEDGTPLKHPPVLWGIELSEKLANAKLIAEVWDAGGLIEQGNFSGYRWAEWNGRFRDDVRRFVRSDPGLVGAVANRIAGSADVFQANRHSPLNNINFVCCHDGFTMMDLVSYNNKHNEANGENNNDGINENFSWNCGVEGETDNQEILKLRKQQVKNYLAILYISIGIPMLLSGDEFGRTQKGNNNAYCQDNEINWNNWDIAEENSDLVRFVQQMILFRRNNSALRRDSFFTSEINERGLADITWHGTKVNSPGWNDPEARVLAFTIGAFEEDQPDIHVMMNMYWETLEFEIPDVQGRRWYRVVDTALPSPSDIIEKGKELLITDGNFKVLPRSIVILISK